MTSHSREPDAGRPEPFKLEPLPAPPPLPGQVIVRATADEAIEALAADLVLDAVQCVRQFGDVHLALSGGSTPQPLYERLMYDPNYRRLPWKAAHLWQVDERCVGPDDPASNFRMIRETIVEHADIPAAQVHPIPALASDADFEYEKEIRQTLCWREKGQDRLDFVLLGMGADGHTASLFPHSDALHETSRLVRLVEAPHAVPRRRVTMTLPLINAARIVAILVLGKGKAAMVQRLAKGLDPIDELPIKGIRPTNGVQRWYLDAEAAGVD